MRATVWACALLLVAGCGGSSEPGASTQPLSVAEALELESGERVLVHGTLMARGDDVRLCSAILESYPPQCGEPSLRVQGLDLVGVSNMGQAKGTTWSPREITLRGEVAGGTLTVGPSP